MIVLDTDILTLYQRGESPEVLRIRARIAQMPREESVVTTIVTYHEQSGGWLAYVDKARKQSEQIAAYARLEAHVKQYREIELLPYDQMAADVYHELRANYRQLGTMDLRIAAIVISHNALLVSRNLSDFAKVAGLRVEDWTKA